MFLGGALLHQGEQLSGVVRAQDECDGRGLSQEFPAPQLGDAASDSDPDVPLIPDLGQPAEIGEELLLRFFPDRAGVDDDQVRLLGALRLDGSRPGQQSGDPLGIALVHLAAERADMEAALLFRHLEENQAMIKESYKICSRISTASETNLGQRFSKTPRSSPRPPRLPGGSFRV